MKKLIERFLTKPPTHVQLMQAGFAILGLLAGYDAYATAHPAILSLIPDGWEKPLSGLSGLAVIALQHINPKKTPDMPQEVIKDKI